MLLDVRGLKALYARVVAGFALGFVAGGLAGPVLLAVLGATETCCVAAAAAAALFLVLVVATRRRYPAELSVMEHGEVGRRAPDAPHAVAQPLPHAHRRLPDAVAIESQWLDFLVFDRAAQRYDDSSELARFISRLLGHRLRDRHPVPARPRRACCCGASGCATGLRPTRSACSRYWARSSSPRPFGARAPRSCSSSSWPRGSTDLTFSDGTSRTSLSAAYQAVPNRLRAVAQATVEGLAVPVAIGVERRWSARGRVRPEARTV